MKTNENKKWSAPIEVKITVHLLESLGNHVLWSVKCGYKHIGWVWILDVSNC
jgi:hypothetical protein